MKDITKFSLKLAGGSLGAVAAFIVNPVAGVAVGTLLMREIKGDINEMNAEDEKAATKRRQEKIDREKKAEAEKAKKAAEQAQKQAQEKARAAEQARTEAQERARAAEQARTDAQERATAAEQAQRETSQETASKVNAFKSSLAVILQKLSDNAVASQADTKIQTESLDEISGRLKHLKICAADIAGELEFKATADNSSVGHHGDVENSIKRSGKETQLQQQNNQDEQAYQPILQSVQDLENAILQRINASDTKRITDSGNQKELIASINEDVKGIKTCIQHIGFGIFSKSIVTKLPSHVMNNDENSDTSSSNSTVTASIMAAQ